MHERRVPRSLEAISQVTATSRTQAIPISYPFMDTSISKIMAALRFDYVLIITTELSNAEFAYRTNRSPLAVHADIVIVICVCGLG
jgi:hypothetical protein